MAQESNKKITSWLKKLEQESWQLELLVSAFTIFLLIQAIDEYSGFLYGLPFLYDLSDSLLTFIYVFLALIGLAIKALTMFLIIHLLLRGFWIGVIGLRSVQETIDFKELKYSSFFTEKLKDKVVSLDKLVLKLDEICSLFFSFAFLIISMIISFGLYLIFLGGVAILFKSMTAVTSGFLNSVISLVGSITVITVLISGLIYFLDYVTLGFFKKFKFVAKLYYPIYRFLGFITLSVISKSIYYYFISKFSKKKIRITYFFIAVILLMTSFTEFDQHQFYPKQNNAETLSANHYDNLRDPDNFINKVSIQSNVIQSNYLQLFIRYDPADNMRIQSNCPDFTPARESGFNWSKKFEASDGGFVMTSQNYDNEDLQKLLDCLSSLYQVSIGDKLVRQLDFYYYTHPSKRQKGLFCMIDIKAYGPGLHILKVKKSYTENDTIKRHDSYAQVPFWIE